MTMAAISLRLPRSGNTRKSQALLPAAKLSRYCTAQDKAAAAINEQISRMPLLRVDIVVRLIRGPSRANSKATMAQKRRKYPTDSERHVAAWAGRVVSAKRLDVVISAPRNSRDARYKLRCQKVAWLHHNSYHGQRSTRRDCRWVVPEVPLGSV